MAIPASGSLGFYNCPNGACSGVAFVVYGGSASGAKSVVTTLQNMGTSIPQVFSDIHGSTIGDLAVRPTPIASISNVGATCPTYMWSACPNTVSISTSCSWLHPCASSCSPNPAYPGSTVCVGIDANGTGQPARSGTVTYTPTFCGSQQTITFCQLAGQHPFHN